MTPNYTLGGRYQIKRSLGEGGMANVYLAHDLILDRDVAVKLLRLDLQDDPQTIKRFQREALATTELVHPHIVSMYDVGEENGMQYLVMEYVKGMDLKNYIKVHFPIPYPQVIDIMEQILSAVATAHAQNIIHRDLKPQNILIDETGKAKITDFGIAIAMSEHSLTQTNTVLGSVHYLSPEQARGSIATKQSDIYSLGIILYEMLTGSVPFEGETAVSIALKHFQSQIPSVRDFDGKIPQALENVVLQATAKRPDDRYASVEAMAADLKTALSTERAGEQKFTPAAVSDDATKILPSAEISAALAKQQQATSVKAVPIDDDDDSAAVTSEAETQPLPKRSWSKQHPFRKRVLIALGVAMLLILSIFLGFLFSQPHNTQVPKLAGTTEKVAKQRLKSANLQLGKVTKHASNSVAKGQIISSTPNTHRQIPEQSRVNLVMSSGPKTVTLGDYVSEDYADAKESLESQGFDVAEHLTTSSTATDQVLSQDVAAGSTVLPNKVTVTLTVSAGNKAVDLKDLTGETQSDIESYARQNRMNVVFEKEYSADQKKGYSVDQSPAGGTQLRAGATLTVTMSKGSAPKKQQAQHLAVKRTVTYVNQNAEADSSDASAMSAANLSGNNVKVYVEDSTHSFTSVYKEMTINHSTSVQVPLVLDYQQVGKYRIVRNGQVIAENLHVTAKSAGVTKE